MVEIEFQELRNLITFITVCENMSYTKAAEQLGYAQSTITGQIHQLEEELGIPLFDRNGKNFSFNQNTKEMLRYAYNITALAEEARNRFAASAEISGKLRIGVACGISEKYLYQVLQSYMEQYPQVQLKIDIGTSDMVLGFLQNDQADLLLTTDFPLSSPDLQCFWMRKIFMYFLCADTHPFAGNHDVSPSEFAKERNFILENNNTFTQTIDFAARYPGFALQHPVEINSVNLILDAVEDGRGVTMLPSPIASEALNTRKLAQFRVNHLGGFQYYQLQYRKSKICSPAMFAFIELSKKIFDEGFSVDSK